MSINEAARADVRRVIMEAATGLTARGRRSFSRNALVAAMARGVAPATLAFELAGLCIAGELRRVRESSGPRPALYALPATVDDPDPDAAPDWNPGYPSTGEKIGAAWAAMWEAMSAREWEDAADLAIVGADAGGILPGTARNLLFPAAAAGFIETEARYDKDIKRWRTWYRRPVHAQKVSA